MSRVHSFPPVETAAARVLVLGSMPGAASLAAGRYYAHPRNLFWPIMGALIGAGPQQPYPERLRIVRDSGIALWETLASCVRPGSLDASIEPGSVQVNDFDGFFASHPQLRCIAFNGGSAARYFRRHVQPQVATDHLSLLALPSTSPAHAALGFEAKLEQWRRLLDYL